MAERRLGDCGSPVAKPSSEMDRLWTRVMGMRLSSQLVDGAWATQVRAVGLASNLAAAIGSPHTSHRP